MRSARDASPRLPVHPHPDRRADRAVRARTGRGDRHRREGDVLLRGQHERRPPHAASRRHRRRGARRHRAQPALRRWQAALVRRPDVPSRTAAEGALSPVPPGRRRGDGARRPGCRRRDHPAAARALARTRSGGRRGRGHAPATRAQQSGRSGRAPGAPRRAGGSFRGPYRIARRGRPAPPAQQPAAHPRHQESGDAGAGRSGPEADRLPGRGLAHALRARCARCSTPPACRTA